jgi:hypothetical protein
VSAVHQHLQNPEEAKREHVAGNIVWQLASHTHRLEKKAFAGMVQMKVTLLMGFAAAIGLISSNVCRRPARCWAF